MTATLRPGFPLSNTDIGMVIDHEASWGLTNATPAGKRIAYIANGFKRNQALEVNDEIRGNRTTGTKIPGVRAPGGSLNGHLTAETAGLMFYAALGKLASTALPVGAPTAALAAGVPGNMTNGTHLFALVVTSPTGVRYALGTPSGVVTVVDNTVAGRANLSALPVLPTGWTKAVYMTLAGTSTPYYLVPASATLGAAVTTDVVNVADGSVGAVYSATGVLAQRTHVITIANGSTDGFPSFMVERHLPFATPMYQQATGAVCNSLKAALKSTGYFDAMTDYLCKAVSDLSDTPYDASPDTDWRNGEKIHNAMLSSGLVLVDGAAFAKFLDISLEHNNNLNTEDFPIGLEGDRGSLVPMRAMTKLTGNMKLTAATDYDLLNDLEDHAVSLQWQFAAYRESLTISLPTIQTDPTDAEQQGQGISKLPFSAEAHAGASTEQITVTLVNSVDPALYETA